MAYNFLNLTEYIILQVKKFQLIQAGYYGYSFGLTLMGKIKHIYT